MVLVPIFDIKQVRRGARIFRVLGRAGHDVVFFDYDAFVYARGKHPGLEGKLFSQLVPEANDYKLFSETARGIVNHTQEYCEGRPEPAQALSVHGVPLLRINELDFIIRRFHDLCRTIYLLDSLIDMKGYQKIVLPFSFKDEFEIIRSYCAQRGIELTISLSKRDIFSSLFRSSIVRLRTRKGIRNIPHVLLPLVVKLFNRIDVIRNRRRAYGKIPGPPLVCFFLSHMKYLDTLVPVAGSLASGDTVNSVVLVSPEIAISEAAEKSRLPVVRIDKYLSMKIVREAEAIWKDLKRKWRSVARSSFDDFSFRYRGIELRSFIIGQLGSMLMASCRQIIVILLARELAKRDRIDCLVTYNYREPYPRCIIAGARTAGSSAVAVKRGLTIKSPMLNSVPVQKLAVSGEYVRSVYTSSGIDPAKIEVTGITIHDSLLRKLGNREEIRASMLQRFNLPADTRIIAYTTQSIYVEYPEEIKRAETDAVFSAAAGIPRSALFVKIHPSEKSVDWYRNIESGQAVPNLVFITDEMPLDELIISANLLVTKFSTTGLDAVVAGCPLLLVDFKPAEYETYPYVSGGVASSASSSGEVLEKMRAILDNPVDPVDPAARDRFIRRHLLKLDGKSGERIAKLIRKMISEK